MLEMYCRFLSEGPCLYLESLQSSHLKWDRKSELYIPVSTFLLCKQGQHFFFCWQVTFKRSCEAHRSCGGQRLRNAKMGGVFFWRKAVSQEDRFGMDCYIYTKFEHVVKSNLSSWNSSGISWKKSRSKKWIDLACDKRENNHSITSLELPRVICVECARDEAQVIALWVQTAP